ncbi:hypothetical protein ACSBR2_030759 [Camellia fascicularis]
MPYTKNYFFLSLLILALHFVSTTLYVEGAVIDQYTVFIVYAVPNNPKPLTVHCQSEYDDIGTHVLNFGEDFHWSFRINIFYTTRFFYHFWCADYCKSPIGTYTCYWTVRPKGFYVTNGNPTWFKQYDWT